MNRSLRLVLVAALALPAVSCYTLARPALGLPPYSTGFSHTETLMVPMKDGVKLKTDVYFPEGKGPWPVILIRNPYNFPGGFGPIARIFTRYGYVAVHQLARGRAASESE